jgi:hypothetical protein
MDDKKIPKISVTFATELKKMLVEDAIEIDLEVVTYEIGLVKEKIAKRNTVDYTSSMMSYLQHLEAKQKHILALKSEHENTNFIIIKETPVQLMGKGGEA